METIHCSCFYSIFLVTSKLEAAEKVLAVADKGVDLLQKVDGIISAKLDSHFEAVKHAPASLLEPGAAGQIAQHMKSGDTIQFKEMPGI